MRWRSEYFDRYWIVPKLFASGYGFCDCGLSLLCRLQAWRPA